MIQRQQIGVREKKVLEKMLPVLVALPFFVMACMSFMLIDSWLADFTPKDPMQFHIWMIIAVVFFTFYSTFVARNYRSMKSKFN